MRFEKTYIRPSLAAPEQCAVGGLELYLYSRSFEEKENEDSVAIYELEHGVALVVADGAGGVRQGGEASERAVLSIREALWDTERPVRESILSAFEEANRRVLEISSATTLVVVEFNAQDATLRSYHAGDSAVLVTGQRGKLKLQTTAHSPVGYAVEAGVMTEAEALRHDERHLVSNMVGSRDMRIELGAPLTLAARDTVVIGTDGLFDNLSTQEIANTVRSGKLAKVAEKLVKLSTDRMAGAVPGPSKPDDLTFLVARRVPDKRSSASAESDSQTPSTGPEPIEEPGQNSALPSGEDQAG